MKALRAILLALVLVLPACLKVDSFVHQEATKHKPDWDVWRCDNGKLFASAVTLTLMKSKEPISSNPLVFMGKVYHGDIVLTENAKVTLEGLGYRWKWDVYYQVYLHGDEAGYYDFSVADEDGKAPPWERWHLCFKY